MKKELEYHIKEIFDTLGIIVPFELYEYKSDILPEWAKEIEPQNEYFICCNDLTISKKIELFIGKTIYKNGNYIYWFEGERSLIPKPNIENKINEESKTSPIEYLKTKTRLPSYIDDLIFKKLNAIYAPDFQRFDWNLNLEGKEILNYLGTYFPRSYSESFCIFDNIFENLSYQQILSKKTHLNILSIGSGTGGDILGLLVTIEKHFPKVNEINILAIDGNSESLNILTQIISGFKNYSSIKIHLYTTIAIFDNISNFQVEELSKDKYDFIISFKFIGEIISLGKGSNDNSYFEFTCKFLPLISNDGLFVLLDVTTKSKHNTYNPILMNRQITHALKELKSFESLVPLPCSVYGDKLCFDCFQQKTFTIHHSKHSNDISKVAYRILVSKKLKEKIGKKYNEAKQLIYNDKICPYTSKGEKVSDAFLFC